MECATVDFPDPAMPVRRHSGSIFGQIVENLTNLMYQGLMGSYETTLLLHIPSSASIQHIIQVDGLHCVPS